ncbi:probable receptor-like protein kinase At5g24010 [Mercurialis annua]|uniref:probable receptor-like protein kinase At5g24010 n=1 Tax=Mercurialis annua TaxID=3986 RepID=UPI00215F4D2D|nr:probable receptor-like protein kinase At5g24010 [Mercurialis annua]
MATPITKLHSSIFTLTLCLITTLSFSTFTPTDNHLINCGSAVAATVHNRQFISDEEFSNSDTPLLSATRTIPLANQNTNPNTPQIYNTARVFNKPSKYVFEIKDPGTHMVRLHFNPFRSSNFDLKNGRFHVLVNGYVVLSNFTVVNMVNNWIIKEYLIWVDSDKVMIEFIPIKRGEFGFVNAIEVISAPKDLIGDVATLVNGFENENLVGLSKQGLEIMYRINVGGPKITPFNDTIWRTWIPDDRFFESSELATRVYFSGRIKYQNGGASREVGPDFVYNTARVISSTNSSIVNGNMTWVFPVVQGYQYLVRLHFCDIASMSLGLLYFNVYLNGNLAYENLDLNSRTYALASPVYTDFVVDSESNGVIRVSIGPSNFSMAHTVDGILNGVEIMKMNNSAGSLDGKMCAGMVLSSWPQKSVGVLVPFVAVLCVLLSVYVVMQRRISGMRDSIVWSKLPTDVSEVALKQGNQHFTAKK